MAEPTTKVTPPFMGLLESKEFWDKFMEQMRLRQRMVDEMSPEDDQYLKDLSVEREQQPPPVDELFPAVDTEAPIPTQRLEASRRALAPRHSEELEADED